MEKKSNVIEDEKLKDVLSIEELEQRLEMTNMGGTQCSGGPNGPGTAGPSCS